MFEMRGVIVSLFLAVAVGWSRCNTSVDTQEKDYSKEIQILQTDLKETRKALSQLILALLNSREYADDLEDGGDVLIRKRRDLPSENEDILSQLPIGSLLGLRGKDGKDGKDGRDGVPGECGVPGEKGRDGRDGKDGTDGDDGKDGRDGHDGRDGVQGIAGISGKDGKDGKDGDSGECGTPVEKGAAGASGIPGKDGNDGRNGTSGIAGNPGEHGPPGEKGNMGTPGMPGQKGAPGISGIAGSPGMPGQRGQDGRPGPPGRSIENTGAVYTRWGRTSCGSQSTLIYSGFAAGSRYNRIGGGVNYQCMPPTPEYNAYSSGGLNSYLSGAEYQSYNYGIFPNQALNQNVPCARCYTNTRPAVMMLPAKRNCPTSWSREYQGYLMSGYFNHNHQSTFECVDSNPEYISGSSDNTAGALFFFVKPICSGEATIRHCPPYINDRQLTCVVCSK